MRTLLTLALLILVTLGFSACNDSTDPVLLDTGSGADAAGEDSAGGDAPVGSDAKLPDSAEEDVQIPCGCVSDAECAPAEVEPCVEWRCVEGADGCGFCGQAPLDCDDGAPCTEDSCDPASGACVHASIGDGEACDDGDACTLADACDADGACAGLPMDCDDLNDCTLDTCDAGTGECTYVNVAVACDDGDPCTAGDTCAGGACQPGPDTPDCDDGNDCTDDACDSATGGCVHTPSTAPGCCEADADCDDANPCTADTCDPDDGSCANVAVGGAPCDDGDACTLEDACDDGVCTPSADLDCADQSECTTDSCDPAIGCVNEALGDGTPCSDGNVCTQGDVCDAGACVPGPTVSCDDGDACTSDQCVPGEGCVNLPIPLPDCCNNGGDCDDGDDCTDDLCQDNLCAHVPVIGPGCCTPACLGKECGPDGCGGSCGECLEGYCDDGLCVTVCVPVCPLGVACGPDGCGGSCGSCDPGEACGSGGVCEPCVPICGGSAECGADGCAGTCGFCDGGDTCSATGQCVSGCDCQGVSCTGDGFEAPVPSDDGSLAGWSWQGDAQVIEHLGATPSPEGEQMALVSTGLIIEENGALWKAFCPPAGPTTLEFEWRFYSEEFVEWCGSGFQDQFQVSVMTGDAFEVLYTVTVQELCPPGECAGCGAQYMGLEEADVAFDQGGVWATPWLTASLPLAAPFASGDGVTVRFDVTDVGDGIYDTAVLVDDVRLVDSPPCAGDEACDDDDLCTQDLCDPATGLCSHVEIEDCCVVDLDCDDGDFCTADSCEEGICFNITLPDFPGCCEVDADCDDQDPCTLDQCFLQQCFYTPTGNPGCCEDEVLLDEDFDDGLAQGWTLEPQQQPLPGLGWTIASPGHSGQFSLQGFGFPFFPGMESVATTPSVTLPGGSGATLDFWYRGMNAQNSCPAGALTVSIGNAVLYTDCQQASDWIHATVYLSDFAPGDVTIDFVPGSGGDLSMFMSYAIDDVVIESTCGLLPPP